MEIVDGTVYLPRREFLHGAAGVAIPMFLFDLQTEPSTLTYRATKSVGEFVRAYEIQEEAAGHKKFLKDRYGVLVETGSVTPQERVGVDGKPIYIEGTALSSSEELEVLRTLRQEIIKYPPDFIREMNLRTFRFLKDYRWGINKTADGMSDTNSRRVCLSYLETGWWNLFGLIYQDRIARTIHHEIAHFIITCYGKIHSLANWNDTYPLGTDPYIYTWDYTRDPFTDKFWMSIKEELFPLGFARGYGKINQNEDIATVSEAIFTNNTDTIIRARTVDQTLHWKFQQFKSYLFSVSKGAFDEHFWRDLEANQAGEDYWAKK